MKSIATLLSLFLFSVSYAGEQIINYDFNDSSYGVLTHGNYWSIKSSGGPDGSPAARLEYSVAGTSGKNLGLVVSSYASNEYTVEFDMRIEGIPYGGSKFLKFFGDVTSSKNNTTFQLNYSGRNFYEVSYYGDVNCTNRFAGGGYATCGSSYQATTTAIDPTGGAWHHYKAWLKRADPGQINGEVKVWWDGTLRLHVSSMDSNPAAFIDPTPGFYLVELGGYNQASSNGGLDGFFADGVTTPWYLWVDNLSVSVGEAESSPVCDSTHLNLCTTTETCASSGGYYCNGVCQSTQCSSPSVCDSTHLNLCTTTETCTAAGGYYCNGVCQSAECPVPSTGGAFLPFKSNGKATRAPQ